MSFFIGAAAIFFLVGFIIFLSLTYFNGLLFTDPHFSLAISTVGGAIFFLMHFSSYTIMEN